jgi:prevent-host-death family protein
MTTIGVYAAKTHLANLLERVANGEHIVITKHGVPVAEISPINQILPDARLRAIEQLRTFRQGRHAGISIRAMTEEGRR